MKKASVLVLIPILIGLIFIATANASPGMHYFDATGPFNPMSPITTGWHEVEPTPSLVYHLTSWEDTDGSGDLTPSDQVDFEDEFGTIEWWHVEWIEDTALIVPNDGIADLQVWDKSQPPPLPEFPLGLIMEIALVAAVAYVGLKKLTVKPPK